MYISSSIDTVVGVDIVQRQERHVWWKV